MIETAVDVCENGIVRGTQCCPKFTKSGPLYNNLYYPVYHLSRATINLDFETINIRPCEQLTLFFTSVLLSLSFELFIVSVTLLLTNKIESFCVH